MKMIVTIIAILTLLILGGTVLHEAFLRYHIEAANPPRGEFIEVKTARLHYVYRAATKITGEKRHPIVLIHGASGNALDMSHAFFKNLAPELEVYSFDRPGLGWSENKISTENMSSPVSQADALAQAIEALGIEKPVIVGFSWGGTVAAAFATHHQDKISAVMALAGVFYPWEGASVWYQKLAALPVVNQIFTYALLIKMGQKTISPAIDAIFMPETPILNYRSDAAVDLILRPQPFINNSIYGIRLRGHLKNMAAAYSKIKIPIVLAAGDRDHTVLTPDQSQRLAKTIKQAHFMHFENAGHMLHHTRIERISRAINDLAQGVSLPAGEFYIKTP